MEIQREQDEEATGDHENDSSTFADYTPKALDGISALMKHPDPVIETSTLSGIDLPKATFKLRLPFQTLLEGRITSLQYETILYACQQHEQILPEGSRCWAPSDMQHKKITHTHVHSHSHSHSHSTPAYALFTTLSLNSQHRNQVRFLHRRRPWGWQGKADCRNRGRELDQGEEALDLGVDQCRPSRRCIP
jgi:hypothetical protein